MLAYDDGVVASLQSAHQGLVRSDRRLHSAALRYRKLQLRFCAGPDLDRLSARILTFLSEP